MSDFDSDQDQHSVEMEEGEQVPTHKIRYNEMTKEQLKKILISFQLHHSI